MIITPFCGSCLFCRNYFFPGTDSRLKVLPDIYVCEFRRSAANGQYGEKYKSEEHSGCCHGLLWRQPILWEELIVISLPSLPRFLVHSTPYNCSSHILKSIQNEPSSISFICELNMFYIQLFGSCVGTDFRRLEQRLMAFYCWFWWQLHKEICWRLVRLTLKFIPLLHQRINERSPFPKHYSSPERYIIIMFHIGFFKTKLNCNFVNGF